MKRDNIMSVLKPAIFILLAAALVLLLLPKYWIFLLTAVFIIGIALQSLGLVTGRTGMISLCQMSFAGVGAWTTGYLNLIEFPGGLFIWILLGGLAAVPVGIAIGLPALRLRGINLAIVTLGFAAAFDTVLATITFPGQTTFTQVARPALFDSDAGYFAFVVGIFALLVTCLELVNRSRLGASWLVVRHSERATAALGISVPGAKLAAFALSSFISGISGGLLAGYLGTLVPDNFSMIQSLALFAVATMTGAQLALGTIIGGVLVSLFPEVLRRLGLPQDVGNVVFALGAVQALSTGETISQTWTRLFSRLFRDQKGLSKGQRTLTLPAKVHHPDGLALEVKNLTVRYGAVVALDNVNFQIPSGKVIGLIGPNGAGKSTSVDAIAGFLTYYEGEISLNGHSLEPYSAHQRAKKGIRRTWQTTRIPGELTVGAYVRLSAGHLADNELASLLSWFDCPPADTLIASVDAGTRRLLDVAGVVAARPPVILLDEPAAGHSYADAMKLGERIAAIPETFGSAVLLIEHDMDLVRKACSSIVVFDFGRVIAAGPTEQVLNMPIVQRAYMGIELEEVRS